MRLIIENTKENTKIFLDIEKIFDKIYLYHISEHFKKKKNIW